MFASYFWLWTIIGSLMLLMIYTAGSLLSFAGFMTPLRGLGDRLEAASPRARLILLPLLIAALAYPSVIHKVWADATASEIRRAFQSLPVFPGAHQAEPTEQMGGLYDPGGTSGAYIIKWFGTNADFGSVRAHYASRLAELGWIEAASETRTIRFIDGPDTSNSHYELVLAVAGPGTASLPRSLASESTAFVVRFGAVDPRVTTQIAWFIDCLVRAAPTFPTCEAMGWHPLEAAGSLPSRLPFGR